MFGGRPEPSKPTYEKPQNLHLIIPKSFASEGSGLTKATGLLVAAILFPRDATHKATKLDEAHIFTKIQYCWTSYGRRQPRLSTSPSYNDFHVSED